MWFVYYPCNSAGQVLGGPEGKRRHLRFIQEKEVRRVKLSNDKPDMVIFEMINGDQVMGLREGLRLITTKEMYENYLAAK